MDDEADNSNLKICQKIKEVANFIPTDIEDDNESTDDRGDATGTAGTATAVPNLCQISSG